MNGKPFPWTGPEFQRLEPRLLLSVLYDANMDSMPDWTFDAGQWEYGAPQGLGSHNLDPTSGHTGTNVVGYNLAGDHGLDMAVEYATTAAIGCKGYENVRLSFWRWLGVESNTYDHASIQVSNNGSDWTDVWTNPGAAISDAAWVYQELDISAVAHDQPTVYIRWGMGPTDSSVTYPGWNIDDVQVTGDPIPGRIEGAKWMDVDADGLRDPDEPGLPGWRIYVDTDTNGQWTSGEPYAFTDASGHYALEDLPPGTHRVAEELQAGWVRTSPGASFYSSDFETNDGGWIPTASWDPVGDWERGAPTTGPGGAYSGAYVWATKLAANYTDSGGYSYLSRTFDFTGLYGPQLTWQQWLEVYYHFDTAKVLVNGDLLYERTTDAPTSGYEQQTVDLSAYSNLASVEVVFELYATEAVSRPGWYIDDVTITAGDPAGYYTVELGPGEVAQNRYFGNDPLPSRIEGIKWQDTDGDGTRDGGEPGLADWRIYLDENANGQWDAGEPYDITDADGNYAIDDVLPGLHPLAEEPRSGWLQTFPYVSGGTLYFSEDYNANGLYALDTTTGAATHVGASGVTSANVGLAPSADRGILYGSKWATLLHINADGSGSVDVGGVGSEGLAYDPTTDTLYATINGDFRTIDPADGTVLLDLAGPGADVESLAYGNGYIYGLACLGAGGGTPGELLRYDMVADAWSLVGDTGLGTIDDGGLAYDSLRNVLYAKVVGDRTLYAVDPATAQAVAIGDTGLDAGGGLAFVTSGGVRIGIDGFEDGDVAEYVEYGSPTGMSASPAAAHDGAYGLLDQAPSGGWLVRDDAAAQVAHGDVLSVWIRFEGTADGRAYFGFGASAGGTLSAVLAPNTDELLIQDNTGFGYLDLAITPQTYAADTWYRLEVDWGLDGTIVATLYASDGVCPLNRVTASTSAITSGGIAFRAFGGDKHFDTVTKLGAGALVGVDFGGGATPGNWTQFVSGPGAALTDLPDENGDTTPFDLVISTSGTQFTPYPTSPDPATLPQHSQPLDGLDNYVYESESPTWTFEWSDLMPYGRCEVYVFGLRAYNGANDVTITGAGLDRTFTQTLTIDDLVVNDELGDSGRELASFAEIHWADDTGRIVIEVTPGAGQTYAALSGLAIRQISPGPRNYLIEVEAGQVYGGCDFGNYPLPGDISGRKSYDIGADGVVGPGEPGLEGWRIYVDANDNQAWDPGEPYDFTDANGNYLIQNVPVGLHTVAEEPVDSGWSQSHPPAYVARAVPFDFEDIHLTGTPELVGNDDAFKELTAGELAGFEFNFCGTTYTSLYFSTNALVTFGSGSGSYNNGDMADWPPQAAIAGLWDDLTTQGPASAVYWEVRGAGDAQRLVIQWHEVEFYGESGAGTITFQVVLGETGDTIRLNYLDLDSASAHAGGASATVGIKGAGEQGPDRLVVCCNDGPNTYVGTGQSTLIVRSGGRNQVVEVGPDSTAGSVHFGNVLLGDADGNGVVDGADYTAWADNYGQAGGWAHADFTGDAYVDGADYTGWADNYGKSPTSAPSGAAAAGAPEAESVPMGDLGGDASLARRPSAAPARSASAPAGGDEVDLLAEGLPEVGLGAKPRASGLARSARQYRRRAPHAEPRGLGAGLLPLNLDLLAADTLSVLSDGL